MTSRLTSFSKRNPFQDTTKYAKRKVTGRSSERHFYMGGGRKSIALLEGPQTPPARPSGRRSIKMKLLHDTLNYKGCMASDYKGLQQCTVTK